MATYEKLIYIDKLKELDADFRASTILEPIYDGFLYNPGKLCVLINVDLTVEIITEIETVMATLFDGKDYAESIVSNAIERGKELLIEFASENVLMGITAAGKTKAVADYLQNIDRYARTGSLYECVNEIDTLIAGEIPVDLSPFVTETRLLNFKQLVLDYLGE